MVLFILLSSVLVGLCSCRDGDFFYRTGNDREVSDSVVRIDAGLPVHFYKERHASIYVHNNGFVTFDDSKIWSPVDFKQSRVFAPCMVEVQQYNHLGRISAERSRKPSLLRRANSEVIAHFASQSDFVAKELLVITWRGILSKATTIQAVYISGDDRSFVQFLYKNENGYNIANNVRSLISQAGFSSGDNVRFTELLKVRAGRNISLLFKSSNMMEDGKWMFMAGSSDESFFQVKAPTTFSIYDSRVGRFVRRDIDECSGVISPCHLYADCFNTDPGFRCVCRSGYLGNGRVCIRKGGRVKLIGKLSGIVNNFAVSEADFDAFLNQQRGELYVSVGPVGPRSGYSLQMVPPIIGLLSWLFGPAPSTKNGFDVIGNRFTATSIIIFQTGEALKVTQKMKGFDAFNFLVFDTTIKGDMPLPITKETSIHRFPDHKEHYETGLNGKIYSDGKMTYILDGRNINYTVNRLITFEKTEEDLKYSATVKVSSPVGSYVERDTLLRFSQRSSTVPLKGSAISTKLPTEAPTPKTERVTEPSVEGPTIKPDPVYPTTSSSEGRTTESISVNGKDIKVTRKPTTKQPQEVTKAPNKPEAVCNGVTCSQFAECKRVNYEERCVCKEGYIGDGSSCKVDERIRCGSYMCHRYGECIREQSQYFCKCRKGYVGDGLDCQVDVPCSCHLNAECYSNSKGSKYCLCKLGFKGDGRNCRDIDECKETKVVCQPHSRCVNTVGSYECVCNSGFRKNDSKCIDIPECTEDKEACGERAICTEIPGSYKCSCPKGFHFGYGQRDCFPDCPRCLNGGTCIGRFGCKCAPGYSGIICQWVGDEFLLYSQGGNIKRFSYPYTPTSYGFIYRNPTHTMIGVDYDCEQKKVYWTDITSKMIQRSNYDGSKVEIVVEGLSEPQGLTIDWLGRNIYWTDNGLNHIEVASLDGKNRKILVSDGLQNPRPIVCNPYSGQLFWADWDRQKPRIEVSSMDGSDRTVLVSRDIGLPNGLTIDYKSRDLCWTDAAFGGLSCIGLDGRNQRVLVKNLGYPFGITVHGSKLMWTNWKTDDIGKFDIAENKAESEVRSGFGQDGRIFDIKSVTSCPARKNLCSRSNGGCTHFCFMRTDGGRTCACPDNRGIRCLEKRY